MWRQGPPLLSRISVALVNPAQLEFAPLDSDAQMFRPSSISSKPTSQATIA
jgi:hypothetical protein